MILADKEEVEDSNKLNNKTCNTESKSINELDRHLFKSAILFGSKRGSIYSNNTINILVCRLKRYLLILFTFKRHIIQYKTLINHYKSLFLFM